MHKKRSEGPWLTGCSPSWVFNVLKMKTKHQTCGREWLQYLSGKEKSFARLCGILREDFWSSDKAGTDHQQDRGIFGQVL